MSLCIVLLVFGFASGSYLNERPDEGAEWSDTKLDTVSLIQKYHYPAELHRVTTKDGYILTLHRIPYGRFCPRRKVKGVVILQHGVFSASTHFVLPGTKNGLGYILADSCYDVWMPNSRGNSHSLGHVKYSTTDYEYWDFSWHEMGIFDHPAVFDYVLNVTGAENATYIGHSQGTTNFLVFNIRHPEYTNKIRAAFLMAPIAYLGHTKSLLLQIVSRIYEPIKIATDFLKIYNILEQNSLLSNITAIFCSSLRPINPIICENAMFLAYGFDEEQSNATFYSIATKNEFYGASGKQLFHYAQLIDSDKFQEYDYGFKNLEVYGQSSPPEYDLTKVQVPVHAYYASNDWLADFEDVDRLFRQLPNLKEKYLVPFAKFNHMDHVFAKDVLELEYDHLVQQIDEYYK